MSSTLPSVSTATAQVNNAIAQAETPDSAQSSYTQVQTDAANVALVGPQDYSDVNGAIADLSPIAAAFQQMFKQGSPVALAQNNIQLGQQARVAISGGENMAQAQNNAQNGAQAAIQNNSQQQMQMAGNANTSRSAILSAQLQQLAINAQITQANAQATMQKQQLATQAQQSAQNSLLSQQSMVNAATAQEQAIQLGEAQSNYNNWMTGIATVGSLGSGTAAVGAKMGSTNTGS